ncbi:hypothetical protein N665_0987s0001 [Sinapis alba]|nr:hypothetical protein N665_0987s0001 [Sinapis alba]
MTGTKDEDARRDLPKGKPKPGRNRGVIISYLSKEEPPDAPCITKPINYQGKALESQRRMKPNLLYLGADYPVSRSKLFQGRGYDAAIKSPAEPAVEPASYSTSLGANKDVCALKMSYLLNADVFHHETNFHGFHTQGEFNPNWNQPKRCPGQKNMNFSNWRFSNPSICEDPSLEDISSPLKKYFDPNKIMEFKRGLLRIHQAKNHEKGRV